MVNLDGVHLTLDSTAGPVNILRGANLKIWAGEAVGLVGPSGSGKSTLMAIVAGLERPTAGIVEVANMRLGGLDEDRLALFRRDNVGIVFQSFHLVSTMTALENVAIPLELAGQGDAFERAAEKLDAVGLNQRHGHYPAQLSGGEQQRVAIARAFAAEPKLLLADEPTGNLDRTTGGAIIELLFAIRAAQGTTLLLITHDPDLASHCGRVVAMEDGRILDGAGRDARDAGTS